ncbi:hypothetical protein M9Y10_021196 [Tritrichomonas musculus]|uniref:non-specific serine/threonine protein kinase n=1 Tax=Tritrichomonas musculus TaxID=1915356 RepID=A0ABR2HD90_9EUKA
MSIEYNSKNCLEVKKVIGEGAYGRAILCKSKQNGELVVVKEIALSNLTVQEQKDAWKEVKILSTLHHPNIISYKGSFVEENILNIVMEYADNGDLFEQIQNANGKHFEEDKILNWFVQICLALKHIHDRKILHRDIKCQNVFLTSNGVVKMGDFGIAKVLDHTTQLSKTAIGTPYYLSPEICQGKNYNQKSDIWSLGCVLYEICTLQHAFDSNCMNGLIMKILRSKHSPIPSFYSSDLRNLVDVLLQKDPKKRPRIHQILNYDFIRKRISNLLDTTLLKIEFSHTVIHSKKSNKEDNNNENNTNNDENLEKYQDNVPAIREERRSANKISNRTRSADTISKNQRHNASANHNDQSMTKAEAMLAQKNASYRAERTAQKEFKQKKEAEEKREKEIYEKKRHEVEENSKKRSKEREQFIQHQKEYKEFKNNFENMDAPFKSVKGNISNRSSLGKKPNSGNNISSTNQKSSVKFASEGNSTKKPDMEGTRRPGRSAKAIEEQENLRALMAKRRAELKKQKNESDDVIQIGKVEIKIDTNTSDEKSKKSSPASSPKPKQEEKGKNPSPLSSPKPKPKQEEKPKEKPSKSSKKDDDSDTGIDENVADLIKFSDDDYDSEDDFHSLATMCKQILDQPVPLNESKKMNKSAFDSSKKAATSKHQTSIATSDTSLLNNDSDDDSEDESPAEPGIFYFGGKEIKLPSVTDRDSLSYRVEAIRQFIEKGLGLDKFIEIYRFIVVENDEMNEIDANKKIHEILSTPDELSYYKLIQQLVVCEETLNDV